MEILEMTTSQLMFYGGAAGTVLCLLIVLISLKTFEKRRKKVLDKIIEEQ